MTPLAESASNSLIKGKVGAAPTPGSTEVYDLQNQKRLTLGAPNLVGNVDGASWSGVISRKAKNPDLIAWFLAWQGTQLNRGLRGTRVFRALAILPMFAAPIALGYLGLTVFYEQGGPVNNVLARLGLPTVHWLSNGRWAMVSVLAVDVWQWTPFVFLVVLIAGTQDVMGVQFWYVSTRLLLAILPPALVALAVQRYVVQGLTLGAVKG